MKENNWRPEYLPCLMLSLLRCPWKLGFFRCTENDWDTFNISYRCSKISLETPTSASKERFFKNIFLLQPSTTFPPVQTDGDGGVLHRQPLPPAESGEHWTRPCQHPEDHRWGGLQACRKVSSLALHLISKIQLC